MIVLKEEEGLLIKEETETRQPAILNLSVWDADLVSSDDVLGIVILSFIYA